MTEKGFTLIEVLIGLFIAVIASISVSQVIASTNKVVDAGRKTFIATNLAHEGQELTRQLRDDTWFANTDRTAWMSQSGLCPDPDAETHTYTIDPELAADGHVEDDSEQKLYIHSDSGLWTHTSEPDSATESGYSRLMGIDCSQANANPAFVTITATVSWTGASGEKNVSIKQLLYNWLP